MSDPVRVSGGAAGYGTAPPVLTGVDFAAPAGASVCVLGPNGGGKTTLFRVLTGQLRPAAGEWHVDGRPAYVPQSDLARLDFPVSALDVATMGTLARGRWWLPARRDDRDAARDALDRVGLADRAGDPFGALSGGQRRRVLIARAIAADARVLLLDEPLAGVDPGSAGVISDVFAALRGEGRTLVVASHDVEGARAFDRVLCLHGAQVAYGDPDAVLTPDTVQATYGSELIVLEDGADERRAVAVSCHRHG